MRLFSFPDFRRFTSVLLLIATARSFSVQPHRSTEFMPSANGLCLVSYNLISQKIDTFLPHIMDEWDVGDRTPNLIDAAGFRILLSGEEFDLSTIPITHITYENGTSIIRVEQKIDRLVLTSYIWTPMILDFKVMMMFVTISASNPYRLRGQDILPYVLTSSPDLQPIYFNRRSEENIWVGMALIYTRGLKSETLKKLKKELSDARPNLLIEAEQRWWMHWHRMGHIPSEIIRKKYEVFLQSAAFIKMAQCREPGPSFGQIVNNLSPTQQTTASVRDMAYSIAALSRIGHDEEAKAALEFMLEARAGNYSKGAMKKRHWGLAKDYQISLSHYTGLGYERSLAKDGFPLIHLDTPGLFLWAMAEYVKNSSDVAFVRQNWKIIERRIIDPLVNSIEATGLVRKDSGLWDVPYPGLHFTYTNLATFLGLNSAATLAHVCGQDQLVPMYTKRASAVRTAILTKLTTGESKILSRCYEVKSFPYLLDASTVEAINWNVSKPFWKTSESIIGALETYLRAGSRPRGFSLAYISRAQKSPENPFIDLRAVPALRSVGKKNRAQQLLAWVIDQAFLNNGMIPEMFANKNADFRGAYPTIGLGAGAYILAVLAME